jgi:hypothetical protein
MVIVTDIDRFGRDVVFIVKNVRHIMRKGAVFVAIDKGFDSRSPMAEDSSCARSTATSRRSGVPGALLRCATGHTRGVLQ